MRAIDNGRPFLDALREGCLGKLIVVVEEETTTVARSVLAVEEATATTAGSARCQCRRRCGARDSAYKGRGGSSSRLDYCEDAESE